MNKKLSDWASIAEIISGIAVVITLIFLILGIKENTEVTRASMYLRSTDNIIEWRNLMISDPEVAQLFKAFSVGDYEGISEVNAYRQSQLVLNVFQIYEQAYFAEQYGFMGRAEWRRFEVQICYFYDKIQASPSLFSRVNGVMTEEFSNFMGDLCQE